MKKTAYVLLSFVLAIMFLTVANTLWGSPIPRCGGSIESGRPIDPHPVGEFIPCPATHPDVVYATITVSTTRVYLYDRSSSLHGQTGVLDGRRRYTGSDGSITIDDHFLAEGIRIADIIKVSGLPENVIILSDIPVTAE